MSFDEEYYKLKKKRKDENQQQNSVPGEMLYRNKTATAEDIAPVAPVAKTEKTKKTEQKSDNKWFKGGAFADGYQFGDIAKTILGTGRDYADNVNAAVVDATENLIDTAAYGVGVVGGLFNKDFQDNVGDFIAKDLLKAEKTGEVMSLLSPGGGLAQLVLGDKTEENSLFGDKADGLVQSGAHLVGAAALGAINPALSYAAIGVNSFGSEIEQAYANDATHLEAGVSGTVAAGAEILFEKLSGGIKIFQGTTLDETAAKWLSQKISNKIVRTLAKWGMDVVGEGAEEVATEYATAVGRKLTYMDEKEFNEIITKEDAWDAFLGGAILGGVAGGGKVANSAVQGRDYTSGMTTEEEAVVNKLYNEQLEAKEKDGVKLTGKQKNEIYDQVIRDMERGRISVDDIERVLGGESYQSYKSTADAEAAQRAELEKQIKELEDLPNEKITVKQAETLKELRKEVQYLDDTSKVQAWKDRLSEEVAYKAKTGRLVESYNERARRGQAFQADLSTYDAKQAEIVKKAAESGILNNTNRTHEFVDMVAKISADKGVLFDFTNNAKLKESGFAVEGVTVNGYLDKKNNTVGVNIDSAKALDTVVGHEITHVLEGTELYSEMQKAVFDYARTKGEFDSRRAALAKLYAEEDIDSEMTADLVGDYLFTDEKFVSNLSVTNRNVFQKIYDEIKYLYKLATAGSKEARELEKVKRAFDKAYREGAQSQGKSEGTKHSLSNPETDKTYLDAVKRGDTETAQRMVDDVASTMLPDSKIRTDDGKLRIVYHGTNTGDFTVFNPDYIGMSSGDDGFFGMGFYFAYSKGEASYYGSSRVIPAYLNLKNPFDFQKELQTYKGKRASGGYAPDAVALMNFADKFPEIAKNVKIGVVENGSDTGKDITLVEFSKAFKDVIENKTFEYSVVANEFGEKETVVTADAKTVEYEYGGEKHSYKDYGFQKRFWGTPNELDVAYEYLANSVYEYVDMIPRTRLILDNNREFTAALKDMGYDGAIQSEYGDEAVAFYPNQIKSADAVTYDDNGNVIPLSERFKSENKDIRYSLSDSDGKQLTKGQQEYFKDSKMRDENGNLKVMYHGSQDAGFHVFDPGMSDDDISFFFVDRNDVAASYSGTSETYEAQSIRTAEDMNKFIESIGVEGYEVIEHDGKFDLIYEDDLIASRDTAKEIYEEFCWYEGVGEGDANYKVYLNLKNPLVVDGKGRPWNKIDAEFSQEIYDKYQSLTAEEKAALTDLAEWEDFSLFNSEIQEATEGDLASAYAKMGEDCNIYDLFSVAADNFSEESMRENARGYLKTRDYAQRAKEQGYDGVIFNNIVDNGGYSNGSEGASTVAIAFESSQIKSVANENPTGDPDIRYSLTKDNQGKELSAAQRDYFKDSKVVDENGSLKVMYHGTPNGDFTVFKDGTYFTENKWYADLYQNPGASSISTGKVATNPKTYEVYLDIKKPFDISDAEARSIYINDYIKGGNAVGINPYLSDAEYDKIDSIDWTEGEDLREFLIDNGYDYDGLVLDEGAVGGYGDDVKYRGKSYVIFSPEQVKNVDNVNPTSGPDIRYSLTEYTAEEKKAHNDAVLEHFGRTFKWNETGYLLLDGARLDLSGKHDGAPGGYRTVDHRDITEALGYDYGGGEYSGSLIQFMSEGNIRIVPEIGGINLSVKPTKAQEQALSDYISRNRGEVVLDIDDLKGNTVVSVEYPRGTFYKKVLDDIREWFDNGKQPEVSGLSSFRSLSTKGEAPTKGRFYGKDLRLEVAPVAETVAETKTEVAPEAVAPMETVAPEADWMPDTEETYAPSLYDLIDERDALKEQLIAAQDDPDAFLSLSQRYGEVMQQIEQMEAEEDARLQSLDDADIPPEAEAPYYERAPITIDEKSLEKITQDVSGMLGLDAEDSARMAQTIQKYAKGELTESDLFDEILDNYEYYEELQVENSQAEEARKFIQGTKLYLPESLKADFNGKRKDGYNSFRREHFGHFTLTTQKTAGARSIDSLYQELGERFPDLFPEDIWNPADQLQQMADVASMKPETEYRSGQFDSDTVGEAVELIRSGVAQYSQGEKFRAFNADSARLSRMYGKSIAPVVDTPTIETAKKSEVMGQQTMFEEPAKKDRFEQMLEREMAALAEEFAQRRSQMEARLHDKNAYISNRAMELYTEISNLRKGVRASKELGYLLDNGFEWRTIKSKLLTIKRYPGEVINPDSVEESVIREMLSREYEDKVYELSELGNEYQKQVSEIEQSIERARKEAEKAEQLIKRAELHSAIVDRIRTSFAAKGFDFDKVLKKAKNLSTFATVDNTPQRVMEKALGYKAGQILADETVNKVAQNETEGIKWLNSYTDRKSGLLAQISKQYGIKPGSKESAAAQMYAEGFYVNDKGEYVKYGDLELAGDFPDTRVQANIKGLAKDPRIRKIYDDTLAAINESRVRNGYPEIPKLDNYFLHFRAMDDTFSTLGLPFNPNDIKAKDLPTDLNGVTADLKPGQPYFASAMHRRGIRTTHDLLGGLERYLTSAKSQIYHIDDIQTFRALRNYIADSYGQANGLESLDTMTEAEVEERIKHVFGSHLSTFAKFLNEEANVLAGKTALIDRGLEGIIGRRGMTFIDNLNKQVGSNMVGYNVSSSLTNFLPVVQTFAKTNKYDFIKGFAQTASNRIGSITGGGDNFAQNSPVMIRRKGADRFHRTFWQKMGDPGYALMGAVDSISTEIIARAKYNELTRKGMDSQQAHYETDKWVSRLMGDRSLGQMPQLYNSKMLGLVTKFQLEVRNQLDSQFYDTIQEAKVSNEHIENQLARNAKTAAKVTSTFFQLAVAQHIFGTAFEAIAGYNPAFDIIGVLITALGLDDEEDSEDTALDNVEQGFLELLEDLPYTSTFTGGRIPISSALPIEQLIKGKDDYGNDKPRWKTALEALPYYVSPGGYGQAKKTVQGLSMFSDKLPVSGSYTDSGNLRFPVEETPGNIAQAAIFGQWASKNAREYFDNDIAPLNPKQTQEYIDVGMSIQDYWKYRKGLSGLSTLEEKAEYIDSLDLTDEQKNILVNNIVDREEDIDMSDYDQYGSFEEFDFAAKNPEKYEFFKANGISYEQYNASEESREAYSWAYNNPEKYTLSKAVSSDVVTYRKYTGELYDIKADKDEDGKSITGSRKEKVIDYINNLDIDYGERLILFKNEYNADDTYNEEIIDYLNNREDISYDEMVTILLELGFTVKNGNVYWD